MGGSTTYGHPYWDETSFAGWMREYLPLVDDQTHWEVINAGGISYGSYRVVGLMEELSQYEPDLFVVYSAHNEFLERQTYAAMFEQSGMFNHVTALLSRTRLWSVADRLVHSDRSTPTGPATENKLPAEVDEELNHTVGPANYHRDEKWRRGVIRHYGTNLQAMIDIARRCHTEIIFVVPAVNEKDFAPFKSELSVHDPALVQEMTRDMEIGQSLVEQGDSKAATLMLQRATEIDKHHAHAHYWYGRALLMSQREQEALQEFQQAIDEDVCPLRAIGELKDELRRVAKRNSVTLVNFEDRLREFAQTQTGSTILGDEFFLDHVHPTIEANRQMAVWILEYLQRQGWLSGRKVASQEVQRGLEDVRLKVISAIDQEDEIFAIRNLAKVLHWSGKFEEAIPRAQDVLDLAPGDPESRYIVASCLANLGRTEQALDEYERLFANGIGYPKAYLNYGELLLSVGQYEPAKAYLMLAILRNPENATAYFSLAKAHTALGEDKFAKEALDKANELSQK